MKYSIALVVIGLFTVSCKFPDHNIIKEGEVTYKISYAGNLGQAAKKLMPHILHLYFNDNKIRIEMKGGLGDLKPDILIDGQKGEITSLKIFDKTAEIRSLLKKDSSLVETDQSQIVKGYICHVYKAKNKNTGYEIWAADQMPCIINGTSRLEGFYLCGYNKIPLKIIDREQDFTVTYSADSISAQNQPDSLFRFNYHR